MQSLPKRNIDICAYSVYNILKWNNADSKSVVKLPLNGGNPLK